MLKVTIRDVSPSEWNYFFSPEKNVIYFFNEKQLVAFELSAKATRSN